MVESRPEQPLWRAAQAWLLAESGHLAAARTELDRLLADDMVEVATGPSWLPTAWLLGEAAVRVGRREESERVYRTLLPWADAIAVVPVGVAVLGSVAKVLGELAASLGDVDDAVAHFETAVGREVRLGSGPLLAWTRLAYGTTLLTEGGRDGRGRGEAFIGDALETAGGYGMTGLVEAARVLLSGAPTAATPSEPGPDVLAPVATSAVPPRRARPSSRLRCFGGFELELRGQPLDMHALKPRVRAVLWVLAASAGRPVHAEQLIDALWPGVSTEAGRRNLQVAISSLRQLLEPGVKRGPWQTVARDGDTYRLVLGDDVDADLRTFELAVAAARTLRGDRRLHEAAERFEQAVRAYGGDLIPEAGPADWIVGRRDGLRLAAADAAHAAAELWLETGDVAAARAACERGLQIDRYRDGLWRLLVRCCEASGDLAAAARAQRDYEAVLTELGLPPH
jgi:DNA-binding SARP family transcriptional activator